MGEAEEKEQEATSSQRRRGSKMGKIDKRKGRNHKMGRIDKKPQREKPSATPNNSNKSKSSGKMQPVESEVQTKGGLKDNDDSGEDEEEEEQGATLCVACEDNYGGDEFWICCDISRASSRRFSSSEEGEALVVLSGILWAQERESQRMIIETDAATIYSFCKTA
ncbi:hypothetical protein GIB67_033658 [Kingdonia uniflora]|uniref:Uncharacterized protein n=1 Tax=Kingdonia uniflora TaxID=39325 RepID=A0A7J7LAV6_9MAGN|nr:hypothetical protein GIB67_033658 [Kingdonia uniflora]